MCPNVDGQNISYRFNLNGYPFDPFLTMIFIIFN